LAAVRLVIAALFCVAVGFGIALLGSSPEPPTAPHPADRSGEEIARLAARIAELDAEIDTASRDEALLRAELARARRALADRSLDPTAAAPPSAGPRFGAGGTTGRSIQSLEEAEAAYEQAFAAGDLEALWLLGADLLAFGEEGYPLFEKLLERFMSDGEKSGGAMMRRWNEEELWLGRFFRAFAEEHESFLAYGLSLAERDAGELGPGLERIRREIFDDEFLPVLLAFHRGEDPELTAGWLDHFEGRLALPDLGGVDPETILFGIAQIPGDRAADLLVDWIETHPDHRDDAIDGLLLQGSPRALEALRALLPSITDESLRAAIEQRLGG